MSKPSRRARRRARVNAKARVAEASRVFAKRARVRPGLMDLIVEDGRNMLLEAVERDAFPPMEKP